MQTTVKQPVNTHRQMSKMIASIFQYMWQTINIKIVWVSVAASPVIVYIVQFIDKYIFRDWNWLVCLCILWLVDSFTGTWVALKLGTFRPRLWFEKMFTKTVVYILWIVIFGALQSSSTTPSFLDRILGVTAINVLMISEFFSAGRNLLIIKPDSRLRSAIERAQDFFKKTPPNS